MIELAILGLLDDNEMHGYELRKRLTDLLGMRLAISFGSLYPALGRLERAGYVKAVTTMAIDAVPSAPTSGSLTGELAAFRAQHLPGVGGASTGTNPATSSGTDASGGSGTPAGRAKRSSSGRAKKVYGITDTGRDRLRALLVDPDVSDERDFAVRVAFCHHLAPAERLDLFAGRRAELVRRRDQRRTAVRSTRRVNTYLRSLLERDTETITADLAWLDRLIDAEREADTTTPSARRPTGGSDRPGPSRTDDTGGPR